MIRTPVYYLEISGGHVTVPFIIRHSDAVEKGFLGPRTHREWVEKDVQGATRLVALEKIPKMEKEN